MPRDQKGRFKKNTDDAYQRADDEGFKLSFRFPSLKALINWLLIIFILMPWIAVIARYDIIGQIINKFEEFITINNSIDAEAPKKNGLFY